MKQIPRYDPLEVDPFSLKPSLSILFNNTLAIASPQLRKLPILSSMHKNGKIDFEWPTEPEMKEMLKE